MFRNVAILLSTALMLAARPGHAQQGHAHEQGMTQRAPAAADARPSGALAGQAAFAAIGEIVRLLEADPATDWTKVDIEGLRRHLIDMDEVTRNAVVRRVDVEGGARFEVRGTTDLTVGAIRRMAGAHGPTLEREYRYRVRLVPAAGGVDLTVLAPSPGDARETARIRALGFVGLLTLGDHHGPHHLSMARGATPHGAL